MKIISYTGSLGTEKRNLEIQKSISHLVFQITGDTYANILTALNTLQLSLTLLDSKTSKEVQIFKMLNLHVLAQIFSSTPMSMIYKSEAQKLVQLIIPVNDNGVFLNDTTKLLLDLFSISASITIDIYGLESHTFDETPYIVERKYVPQSQTLTTFGLTNQDILAVLKGGPIIDLNVKYKNGASCHYSSAELSVIDLLDNDVVGHSITTVGGNAIDVHGTYSLLDISEAESIEITTNGDAMDIYLLTFSY